MTTLTKIVQSLDRSILMDKNTELLYGYMACDLGPFAHSSSSLKKKIHNGVVVLLTDP